MAATRKLENKRIHPKSRFSQYVLSVRHILGVPLCVQRPAKTMPFQQIIMHALQCQHDVDVHCAPPILF